MVKLAGYVEPSPQSVVIVADSTVSADFTLTQIPPQPVLTTIVVTPAVKIVQTGATQQFTATGYDQFGQVMPCSGIVWTSSDETVGTIDTNGLFEALTEGSVVITATCDNVAGSADVTVCNEPPAVPEFPTLLVPLGIIGAILMVSMVFRRD
ncbi:MAG: hypothetical protein APR53_00125 [Methanoculleus sp. SDB]|nr:MAG: hypothetical protein APR53_00125 [Methanoculleus sp. SDB]